jgi:hypothetical protein
MPIAQLWISEPVDNGYHYTHIYNGTDLRQTLPPMAITATTINPTSSTKLSISIKFKAMLDFSFISYAPPMLRMIGTQTHLLPIPYFLFSCGTEEPFFLDKLTCLLKHICSKDLELALKMKQACEVITGDAINFA